MQPRRTVGFVIIREPRRTAHEARHSAPSPRRDDMLVHEWITVAYGGNWEDAGRKKQRLSELLITAATATFITHPADAAS